MTLLTPEHIKEGNMLIAKFMNTGNGAPLWTGFEKTSYNNSWDWLMPVVEKIEQGNYGFKMCRKVVEVYFDNTKEIILKTKEANRMQSLFKAIIDFIIWHNQQKQQP